MKRISFVVATVCLCLVTGSCRERFSSEKTVYVSIEGTVDGVPFSREINSVATTFHPHREYWFYESFYGLDSLSVRYELLDTLCAGFECEIQGNEVENDRDIDLFINIRSKDTTCFRSGKRYFYDKTELKNRYTDSLWWDNDNRRWLQIVENQFRLRGIQDKTSFKENYEQGWFQFDIIEKDGIRFSLTFECNSYAENEKPHIVFGKVLFYDKGNWSNYKEYIEL